MCPEVLSWLDDRDTDHQLEQVCYYLVVVSLYCPVLDLWVDLLQLLQWKLHLQGGLQVLLELEDDVGVRSVSLTQWLVECDHEVDSFLRSNKRNYLVVLWEKVRLGDVLEVDLVRVGRTVKSQFALCFVSVSVHIHGVFASWDHQRQIRE